MIEAARLAVQEGYEGTMHRYCFTAHCCVLVSCSDHGDRQQLALQHSLTGTTGVS